MAIVPGEQIISISVADKLLPEEVLKYIDSEIEGEERNIDSAVAQKDSVHIASSDTAETS